MFSIPFTFIGVILSFFITRTTVNIISYLGLIMLMGIVVNNAIVLISYIILLRARGETMQQAVQNAGRDRLRPVLMTTITTLAGLLPLAISAAAGHHNVRRVIGLHAYYAIVCADTVCGVPQKNSGA
jgi:hydrophobic/amphiphilic exporter-1 (mainly G- bacteria), HAE1 family